LAGIRTSQGQVTQQGISNALAYWLCGLKKDEVRSVEGEGMHCKD
jgi:hypothetical protein